MPLVTVPTLTDGVVTLRAHDEQDVEAIVEQSRDPLSVRWTKVPQPYSREEARRFVRDVMPAMSKMGCNAGTCHGAQSGKNGFKLSLRGYDPLFDHIALTDDLAGRRFNRAAPDTSLMLLKPAGAVPHVGGVLFQPGEEKKEPAGKGAPRPNSSAASSSAAPPRAHSRATGARAAI